MGRGDRDRDRGGVIKNAIPNDERVPTSIGRASNPNKAEIPERAADRNRRGKTQRVSSARVVKIYILLVVNPILLQFFANSKMKDTILTD